MQAWLPVILLWFISLFTSTLTVITCIYRHLDHDKYRWKNIHKHLSPWILLALLTAAFMVGNVWLIASSRESDVDRMTKHAGLFIGLFVGLFFIVCGITAILWRKYQKRASNNRIAGEIRFNESTRATRNRIQQNSESAATSFENHHQTLDKNHGQNLDRRTNNELTSNFNQNLPPNDDILFLRNLSNPNEEFCLDLSNSSAPVVKRKSMISLGYFFEETILPKAEMYHIEDHGVTLDFEC